MTLSQVTGLQVDPGCGDPASAVACGLYQDQVSLHEPSGQVGGPWLHTKSSKYSLTLGLSCRESSQHWLGVGRNWRPSKKQME